MESTVDGTVTAKDRGHRRDQKTGPGLLWKSSRSGGTLRTCSVPSHRTPHIKVFGRKSRDQIFSCPTEIIFILDFLPTSKVWSEDSQVRTLLVGVTSLETRGHSTVRVRRAVRTLPPASFHGFGSGPGTLYYRVLTPLLLVLRLGRGSDRQVIPDFGRNS